MSSIQEALKETGRAYLPDDAGCNYASEAGAFLRWWDIETKVSGRELYRTELFSNNWQPYHEVKEIKPEKVGELWKRHDEYSLYYATYKLQHKEEVEVKCLNDGIDYSLDKPFFQKMIHNQNGWTRLYPPVEDDSIERIEIENVHSYSIMRECLNAGNIRIILPEGRVMSELTNKPPMKMILEIPKKPHECQD